MYDPKFEKAVRQRMEELEFHPAESVWASVEKAIGNPRQKRRGGFIWRFVLPGLLVAATAGFYIYHRSGTMVRGITPPVQGIVSAGAGPAASTKAAPIVPPAMAKIVSPRVAPASASRHVRTADNQWDGKAEGLSRMTADGRVGRVDRMTADVTTEELDRMPAGARISPWLYTPGRVDQRSSGEVRAMFPNTRKGMVSLTSLSPSRHPWEAGFAAGGGLSRLNRLNASYASRALSPQALSFYAISVSSSGKNYISDVRSDVSFHGGIYLQKALANRWILNTGLNLHYYSTRIHVGQQVNAAAAQSAPTLWNYPAAMPTTGVPVYSAGDQHVYTNQYYFLELPVALQWKMNKSKMLPLFLQGGFSVARLMSANALYYNPQTGVYSKDGSMVNKTQFNIGAAVLVGLPFRGIRIQAGPEVQYGVTPLVNNQRLGDQHLFYAGLRVVLLPH